MTMSTLTFQAHYRRIAKALVADCTGAKGANSNKACCEAQYVQHRSDRVILDKLSAYNVLAGEMLHPT